MNIRIKNLLINKLQSNKYRKTNNVLRKYCVENDTYSYSLTGLLFEIYCEETGYNWSLIKNPLYLPDEVLEWSELNNSDIKKMNLLNDYFSFEELSNIIGEFF